MAAENVFDFALAPPKHDWSRFDAMSETQRNATATHDPDAMPLTPADSVSTPTLCLRPI
jgi:hypothetical protein